MNNVEKEELYPKSTQTSQMIEEDQFDEWRDVGYRPNRNCKTCKGYGFLHPRDGTLIRHDKLVPCRAPGCLYESIQASMGRMVAQQTFDSFIPVPGSEKALKAARELATGKGSFVWLLIFGPPGNGKTHLCNAMVRATRDRGIQAHLVLSADLFAMLREGIEKKTIEGLLKKFKSVDFLAIDDYGVEYGTEWEMAKFDEIMTSRYARALPTVLITNKDITELPDRVQSRFKDRAMAKFVHNRAPDFRSSKKRVFISAANDSR